VNLAEEDLGPYATGQELQGDPELRERPLNWLAAQVGRDRKLTEITTGHEHLRARHLLSEEDFCRR
jgi:hypothetical protein